MLINVFKYNINMEKSVQLSQIDRKILRFLLLNGAHFSEYDMAKRLRLSQTTINYKLKRLKEKGVIRGYKYLLNPAKIGYKYMAWVFLETREHSVKEGSDTKNKLLQHPNVFAVWDMSGDYDILAKVLYDKPGELNGLLIWIGDHLKEDVYKTSTSFVTQSYKIHQVPVQDGEKVKLSKTDLKIIEYKQKNPLATIREVSEALKIHRNTVSSKWRRFWADNVLLKKGVIIHPDYLKDLGVNFKVVVLINSIIGERDTVVEEIQNLDEIHELTAISTHHDLLAVVKTGGIDSCFDLIRKIYKTDRVHRTKTLLVFSSVEKDLYSPYSIS